MCLQMVRTSASYDEGRQPPRLNRYCGIERPIVGSEQTETNMRRGIDLARPANHGTGHEQQTDKGLSHRGIAAIGQDQRIMIAGREQQPISGCRTEAEKGQPCRYSPHFDLFAYFRLHMHILVFSRSWG